MKFAFLEINATTAFGGVQTGVWNFAREFAREGHDVTVIGGEGKIGPPFEGSVKTLTFPFTSRKRFPGLGLSFPLPKLAERVSFAMRGRVRAAVARGGFDWVILHKPLDFFWPWLPGIPRTTRFALMSGGTDFMPFDRRLVRKVNALFGCSNFNAWQLLDHFGRHAQVATYGVDTERFAPRPREQAWRAQFGCGSEDVLFGFAGRLVGWKGLANAIRALSLEPLKGLPVRLMIAGDGPARSKLEQLTTNLGLTSRVHFLGALEHAAVAPFYSACDVGVFPSISDEGFPITVAEAMSCGIAVIGSHIGGMSEVVGNEGTCGFLVPPGDSQALAAKMADLVASPQLRLDLGSRARERIHANFTWRKAGNLLLRALINHGGLRSPKPAAP